VTIKLEFRARNNLTHLLPSQCAFDCEGCRLIIVRKLRISFTKMNITHRKIWSVKEKSVIFTVYCFLQDYSKEAVAHVQMFLMKNEVPVNLFEVSINSNQSV
jgi:hypothetical protein